MATAASDFPRYAPVLDREATRPMTRKEEQRVTRLYRQTGDPDALRRMVEANQHFVIMVARQYQGMGLPLEDIVSEGNVGLLQAADRFDPDKGIKFITYAVWWIRRAILQALSDQSRLVRLPKYKIRQVRSVRDRLEELRRQLGRDPQTEEVARAAGIGVAEAEDLLTLGAFEVSMDVETEGDGTPFDSYLSEDRVEAQYYEVEVSRIVRDAIDRLSQKERHVVLRRFEFVGCGSRNTLEVISRELGLTKERVRQIELQAKKRLREWFLEGAHNLRLVDGVPT